MERPNEALAGVLIKGDVPQAEYLDHLCDKVEARITGKGDDRYAAKRYLQIMVKNQQPQHHR
ncbi:hypothetical protein CV019_00470, partial [Staphylococcus haemolyticus]